MMHMMKPVKIFLKSATIVLVVRNSDIHVSSRLAAKESKQTIIAPAMRRSSSCTAEVRSASQLQEIPAGTSSNYSVSGYSLQYQGRFDLSDRGEVSEAYVSHANDMQSA